MKVRLLICLCFVARLALSQTVYSPDYPRVEIGKYSIATALDSCINLRKDFKELTDADKMKDLPLVSRRRRVSLGSGFFEIEKAIFRIKTMRESVTTGKALVEDGEQLIRSIDTLIKKSKQVLRHVESYAPWPSLKEMHKPSKMLADIMPDCCDYMGWYNDYLFIVAHVQDIELASGRQIRKVGLGDRMAYGNSFSTPTILKDEYSSMRNLLLFNREQCRSDIQILLNILSNRRDELARLNLRLSETNKINKLIYDTALVNVRANITANKTKAKWTADSLRKQADDLKETVIQQDSLITVYSLKYRKIQKVISVNDKLLSEYRKQSDLHTRESLELITTLDGLRQKANKLLANCKQESASDACVKFPDTLKYVNAKLSEGFKRYQELSALKVALSDSILTTANNNLLLAKESEAAHLMFEETVNQHPLLAAKYQRLGNELMKEAHAYEYQLFLCSSLEEKLKYATGEEESPLMKKIKELQISPPTFGLPTFSPSTFPTSH